MLRSLLFGMLLTGLFTASAQPLVDHWYTVSHQLPRHAGGGFADWTLPDTGLWLANTLPAITLRGQQPTERQRLPLALPGASFTLEAWLLDHVNQPVGLLMALRNQTEPFAQAAISLGYFGRQIRADQAGMTGQLFADVPRGFKKYWYHLALTGDGDSLRLYVNGRLQATALQSVPDFSPTAQLEIAGYFESEPWMGLRHLLQHLRVQAQPLSGEAVAARYAELSQLAEQGIIRTDVLHLTAGPYLFRPTQQSIELAWEADRPVTTTLRWGSAADQLSESWTAEGFTRYHHHTLSHLEAGQRYYYQLRIEDEAGEWLETEVLSLATAVPDSSAWSFAVCGDPEARPHVNQRLSELVWEERPNFLINLGDLTDGGQQDHRFEWTHEYFAGMGALHTRIPVFPVAGNGESDLYWYRHYHGLPADAPAYYTFTYGNAQFFVLNSNEGAELAPGGEQYEWLARTLATSTATWKFVAHHHAPFSSDEDDYGNTWEQSATPQGDLQLRELVPLYEQHGVDIVFFGHLHVYERTWPIRDLKVDPEYGVVYLVSGGAGGNLEDFAPSRSWFTTKLYRGHHYSRIDIFAGKLYFKMYDLHGALKDYMELEK